MKPIAFITYEQHLELDHDDRLIAFHLSRYGMEVVSIDWEDKDTNWSSYSALILRSCWNYHFQIDPFLYWVSTIKSQSVLIYNPPDLVTWNSDKRYLLYLQEKGITIPSSLIFDKGTHVDPYELMESNHWKKAVVKPRIGAGGHDAMLISEGDSNEIRREVLLKSSNISIKYGLIFQEYVNAIKSVGEWSFVFLGGQYSHALLRRPADHDFRVQGYFGGKIAHGLQPSLNLIDQAHGIIQQIPNHWLYARADAIDDDGQLKLMELELIEPSLYFWMFPHAASTFAYYIHNFVTSSGSSK